jgi:hypothetical protein
VMPFAPKGTTSPGRIRGAKWLVSNGGGWSPIWSHNGRELFYETRDSRQIQMAAYTAKGDSFVAEKPRVWSDMRLGETGIFGGFDVAPDGERVLALLAAEDPKAHTLLRLLLNVDSELRRRTAAYRK